MVEDKAALVKLDDLNDVLLLDDSRMSGEERWQLVVSRLRMVLGVGRASRTLAHWYIGQVYYKLCEEPYLFAGAPGQPSQRDLSAELDLSMATIHECRKLFKHYPDFDLIRQAAPHLTGKQLNLAANLSEPRRSALVRDLAGRKAKSAITSEQVTATIAQEVEEQRRLPDDSGNTRAYDGPPAKIVPPLRQLRTSAQKLIALLQRIQYAVQEDRMPLLTNEEQEIIAALDCLDAAIRDVREALGHPTS